MVSFSLTQKYSLLKTLIKASLQEKKRRFVPPFRFPFQRYNPLSPSVVRREQAASENHLKEKIASSTKYDELLLFSVSQIPPVYCSGMFSN